MITFSVAWPMMPVGGIIEHMLTVVVYGYGGDAMVIVDDIKGYCYSCGEDYDRCEFIANYPETEEKDRVIECDGFKPQEE